MTLSFAIALVLHQLASLIWVGGMFFAHVALRPTLAARLEPGPRLSVALGVFERFFPWVRGAIAILWLSGLWIFLGVMGAEAGLHVHLMMGIAALMTAIFAVIDLRYFRRLRLRVAAADWPAAAAAFAWIRRLMATNLVLGLGTVMVASGGLRLLGA